METNLNFPKETFEFNASTLLALIAKYDVPIKQMSFMVSNIVGGVNEQNSIVNNVGTDDFTAEKAIVDSNDI